MPGDANILLERFRRWTALAKKFNELMRFNKDHQKRFASLPSIWKVEGSERSGRADTEKWRAELSTSEARRKALEESGLRYDERLRCYVTVEGKVVLTDKDWFSMTPQMQQGFIKTWQNISQNKENWRDWPLL